MNTCLLFVPFFFFLSSTWEDKKIKLQDRRTETEKDNNKKTKTKNKRQKNKNKNKNAGHGEGKRGGLHDIRNRVGKLHPWTYRNPLL